MSFISQVKFFLFGKQKEKVVERKNVLGHYDSKPSHNFRYALTYAGEKNIFDTKEESDIEVFSRVYKGVTFVNILVNNDVEVDLEKYKYENIKDSLIEAGITATNKSICVMCFQHYTKNTLEACLNYCNSDKNHFYQGLVYNPEKVQMDYYRPVPKYMNKMFNSLCEDLYFDLGFLDWDRD